MFNYNCYVKTGDISGTQSAAYLDRNIYFIGTAFEFFSYFVIEILYKIGGIFGAAKSTG